MVTLPKIHGNDDWLYHTAFLHPTSITENGHHEFRFKFEIDGELDYGKNEIAIGVADADKYETELFGKNGIGDCAHSWSLYCTIEENRIFHKRDETSSIKGNRPLSNGDIVTMMIEKKGQRNEISVLCDAFPEKTLSFGTHTSDIERVKVGVSIYVNKMKGSETRLRLIDYVYTRMDVE